MLIRRLKNCSEIMAGDNTRLRELLHPDRDYEFGGRYSLAHASLPPGVASHPHRLTADEVYYIISGCGSMHVDDETSQVGAGDAIEIPPGSVQWIECTGETDLKFLCIVDPAWSAEQEEILP
jgi:mannose-6-phosphate isomerase-like protein (cupin superfamily)